MGMLLEERESGHFFTVGMKVGFHVIIVSPRPPST